MSDADLSLDGMDNEMKAYLWHLMRRRMEQGRLTRKQWVEWAGRYIGALEDSPWRDFCKRQVHSLAARSVLGRARFDQFADAMVDMAKAISKG